MSIFGMVYTGRKSQILVIFTLNKIFVRHSYLKVSQVVTSIISAAESSRRGALRGSSGSRRQAVLASPGSPWRAAATGSWSCRPTVATGRCSAWAPPRCWSCCSTWIVKYTKQLIVCEAFCHQVICSFGHPSSHSVMSSCHPIILSTGHPIISVILSSHHHVIMSFQH